VQVGSGGASGVVTDRSETFGLENLQSEAVVRACTGRLQYITCYRNTILIDIVQENLPSAWNSWLSWTKISQILRHRYVNCHVHRLQLLIFNFTTKERLLFTYTVLNPLNAELNPICHLLALLGGATIVVVSRLRVNITLIFVAPTSKLSFCCFTFSNYIYWRICLLNHSNSRSVNLATYKSNRI
jgi:midasin (ATPase involved in ribosome maturation)